MKIFAQKQVVESKPWFGLEQEFFIRKSAKGYPLGMDKHLYTKSQKENIQGPYIVVWEKEIVIVENLWTKLLSYGGFWSKYDWFEF